MILWKIAIRRAPRDLPSFPRASFAEAVPFAFLCRIHGLFNFKHACPSKNLNLYMQIRDFDFFVPCSYSLIYDLQSCSSKLLMLFVSSFAIYRNFLNLFFKMKCNRRFIYRHIKFSFPAYVKFYKTIRYRYNFTSGVWPNIPQACAAAAFLSECRNTLAFVGNAVLSVPHFTALQNLYTERRGRRSLQSCAKLVFHMIQSVSVAL